jgi:hypothetical protein
MGPLLVAVAVGAAQQLIYIQILPILYDISDQMFDIAAPLVGQDCMPLRCKVVGKPAILVTKLAGP